MVSACWSVAVVLPEVSVGGGQKMFMRASRPISTCDKLLVHSTMQGGRVWVVVLVELGDISSFSTFGIKSAFF